MTRTDYAGTMGRYHVFFQYSPFEANGGAEILGNITPVKI